MDTFKAIVEKMFNTTLMQPGLLLQNDFEVENNKSCFNISKTRNIVEKRR